MNEKVFVKPEINEDLAYICGVLTGDGCFSSRENKGEYMIKCVGNPKDEIDFYEEILKPLIFKVFRIKIYLMFFDNKTTYGFRIYSKELFNFLVNEIGLPRAPKKNFGF